MDTLALSLAVETTGTGTQRPRASVPLGLFSRGGRDVSYFGWKGQVASFARFVLLTKYCYCCYHFTRLILIPMKLLLERLAVWTFLTTFSLIINLEWCWRCHQGAKAWSIWYWSDSTHEFFLDCQWNKIIWAFLSWLQELYSSVFCSWFFQGAFFRFSKKSETSILIAPIYYTLPETNSLPDQVRGGKIMVQCTDPSPFPTQDSCPSFLPSSAKLLILFWWFFEIPPRCTRCTSW